MKTKRKSKLSVLGLLLSTIIVLLTAQCALETEQQEYLQELSRDVIGEGDLPEDVVEEKIIWQGSIELQGDRVCKREIV